MTVCDAGCWTDHRRVISKLNPVESSLRGEHNAENAPKRLLDVSKLNQGSTGKTFLNLQPTGFNQPQFR